MKKSVLSLTLLLAGAAIAAAQGGPGPGGPPHGPGPGFGPGGRGGFGPGFAGRGPVVTGAPYSGTQTIQMQQKLGDGNTISRQDTVKVYRDSQGRTRTESTMTPPGSQTAVTHISITDPVAGVAYMLNPADQTAVKITLPPARTDQGTRTFRGPNNGAETQTTDLGTQTVNGVQATGTRTTTTIPAGAVGNQAAITTTREVWTAVALKVPVQIKTSDPRFGENTMNLTNITQGEPDPTLFQPPASYTVTTRGQGRGAGFSPQGMRGRRQ